METGTDMVLAYQRILGEQRLVVLCNLDGKRQTIQTSGQWKDFKVLLENYEGREMVMEEGTFTMEPYGFMVLISK